MIQKCKIGRDWRDLVHKINEIIDFCNSVNCDAFPKCREELSENKIICPNCKKEYHAE
jgi:hypothetical protein